MRWSEQHDVIFLREVLSHEPFNNGRGSLEGGKVWETIAETLNALDDPTFHVTQKSVRDRYKNLADNYKKKVASQDKQSGIDVEETEVDVALADLIERFNEGDQEFAKQSNGKKAKDAADAAKATEMRKRSLETYKESRERLGDDDEKTHKRPRNNGTDTINYLREKSEAEIEIRKRELDIKQQEQKNFQTMMAQMSQTVRESQEMNNILLQQQTAFMACLQNLSKK